MIQAGLGRFGPYLKYQGSFASLPAEDDLLTIGLNRAVDLLAEATKKRGGYWVSILTAGMCMSAGCSPYVEHTSCGDTGKGQ